jgi:hypothetical protein
MELLSMTKLEQVARAMAVADGDGDRVRDHWLRRARSAVEALREPNKVMEDAGYLTDPYNIGVSPPACWRAMIDAILSEKSE